jgi:UDP-N-acetyl-D-mannosaminuronic acid dehydrogenase
LQHKFSQVSVIGLGYIGFPTAVVLANHGIRVIGVDINEGAVASINRGEVHIFEPGLEQVVSHVVSTGKLSATTKPEAADAFIIAVPTPFRENHEPDLRYVEDAARSIAPALRKGNLVVLESTSPVGTTERVSRILNEERPDLTFPHTTGESADVQLAYCPERVLPGKILQELIDNDRVIGGLTPYCAARATALYNIFLKGRCFTTNARTAEMTKLTENSFRDVNIAFANELSLICDDLDINVWDLIDLANRHPRVHILQPGPGVGGHCIAVDPWFIVHSTPALARLIETARNVNDSKPHHVVDKVRQALQHSERRTIACLGLAFKADIDDLRESPAVDIVLELQQKTNAQLLVVEPYVKALPPSLKDHSHTRLTNTETALAEADIVLVLVNHKQFCCIDEHQLRHKTIIDTRGIFRSEAGISSWRQRAGATGASSGS